MTILTGVCSKPNCSPGFDEGVSSFNKSPASFRNFCASSIDWVESAEEEEEEDDDDDDDDDDDSSF